MNANDVHDSSRLRRPPVHPSRSSALSVPVPPRATVSNQAIPPIHPSRSSVDISTTSTSSPNPPPSYAAPELIDEPTLTTVTSVTSAYTSQLPPRDLRQESSRVSAVTQASAPSLPPRPAASVASIISDVDEGSGSDSESENGAATPTPELGGRPSTDTLANALGAEAEEGLSEVQLRELYDDEEIDRFLNLFSSYVREVRVTQPAGAGSVSASTLDIIEPDLSTQVNLPVSRLPKMNWNQPISEAIAMELVVPLLPPPRGPLPEFSIGRSRQTVQRLYVALEPMYTQVGLPLFRLATWKDTRKSFGYCALYWILWYHSLLLSGVALGVLYLLLRRKIHPYPSLAELRQHRDSIDRSQAIGSLLATRLANAPSLGIRDVWDIFGDYRHLRKVKKAQKEVEGEVESVREHEEAHLKRTGLFLMNESADFAERMKNIFLWRDPTASAIYGTVILGWVLFGLLPARYISKLLGAFLGIAFWHIIPVVVAIPASERNRLPSPLSIVPTDTEYAMELISQRVARGLPVKAKRKRPGRHSSKSSMMDAENALRHGSTSSVDWNKVGDRIATTKVLANDLTGIFRQGQWKKVDNWKTLNPLASKTVATQGALEPSIQTQSFPATMRSHGPGLVTLTSTTLFFTPLLSSHPVLTIELINITGVKKTKMTKGIDIHYGHQPESGGMEEKEASLQLVGGRSELFGRLVGLGGNKWAKV